MKTLLLLLLSAGILFAEPPTTDQPPSEPYVPVVKLTWDQPDQVAEPDFATFGYRVWFSRTAGPPYEEVVDIGHGEWYEHEVYGPQVRHTEGFPLATGDWFSVVTVYNEWGLESMPSNEIQFTMKTAPQTPGALRVTIVIESSADLQSWEPLATIFDLKEDKKFYRLAFLKPKPAG